MSIKETKMNKTILRVFIAAAAVLLLCGAAVGAVAAADHIHDNIRFQPWGDTAEQQTSLPSTPGSYYLTHDITLSGSWYVPSGAPTNLCLNGHVIQLKAEAPVPVSSGFSVIFISGTTLNLFDCGSTKHKFSVNSDGLWVLDEDCGTETLYGGCITGGVNKADYFGGGVCIFAGGTFNMYGGNIVGNSAGTHIRYSAVSLTCGGGVYIGGGTFTLHGGKVVGNRDGGVCVCRTGRLVIDGGEICNNTTSSDMGGGVFAEHNSYILMKDGNIHHNKALSEIGYGGGVCVTGAVFTMEGGEISDNTASTWGGGVYVGPDYLVSGFPPGSFTMTGGIIKNNTATEGGGGVHIYEYCNFTMTGGNISGNTAEDGGGGGVYMDENSSFTLRGGSIMGNTSDDDGGGVYVDDESKIYVEGPVSIKNNFNDGEPDNLYLDDDDIFTLTGPLAATSDIRITEPDDGEFGRTSATYIPTYDDLQHINTDISKPAVSDAVFKSGVYQYASLIFAEKVCGVAFEWNHPGRPATQAILSGGHVSPPKAPQDPGFVFGGWYTDSSLKTPWDFEDMKVYNGTTLYGKETVLPEHPLIMYKGNIYTTNTIIGGDGCPFNEKNASYDYATNTLKLKADVDSFVYPLYVLPASYTSSKIAPREFTIDLNGHVLDFSTFSGPSALVLTKEGLLKVTDTGHPVKYYFNYVPSQNRYVWQKGLTSGDLEVSGGCILGHTTISGVGSCAGGAVLVENGAVFVLNGGNIVGNVAKSNGGGVYVENGGKFLLQNVGLVTGNVATGNGGGVYVDDGGEFTLSGRIVSNRASNGGGVYLNGGSFTMSDNSVISSNYASNGGGLYNNAGVVVSSGNNSSIHGNTASENGGGIYIGNTGKVVLEAGTTVSGNQAVNGGGVYNTASGGSYYLSLVGRILDNTASENGGGVYTSGSFNMSGGSILSNAAVGSDAKLTGSGGGVFVGPGGSFVFSSGLITENRITKAMSGGAGVFVYKDGTFTMSGGKLTKNNAGSAGYGGGVCAYDGGTITLSGGVIGGTTDAANTATYGGGIYVENGTLTMTGGEITHNYASIYTGGVVFCNNDSTSDHIFAMSGGTISQNSAYSGYSGVAVGGAARDKLIFKMSGSALISADNELFLANGLFITVPDRFTTSSAGAFNILFDDYKKDWVIIASAASKDIALFALDHFKLSETHSKFGLMIDSSNPRQIIALNENKVTVTFNSNGGSAVPSQLVDKGNKAVKPADPIKAGNVFKGWFTKDGTSYDFDTPVNADLTLYAKWDPLYHITYEGNGATSGSAPIDSKEYTSGSSAVILDKENLEKTDYHFVCWNTQADGLGTGYIPGAETIVTGNLTLYAKWEINPYTVSYDSNGATSGSVPTDSGKYNTNDSVTVKGPGDLKKTDSHFNGWTVDGDTKTYGEGSTYTIKSSSVIFKAKWEADEKYTLAYNANGATTGRVPDTKEYFAGAPVTIDNNSGSLQKTGYTFKKNGGNVLWSTSSGTGGTEYTGGSSIQMPANDLVLYAQWVPIQYTITYNSNFPSETTKDQSRTYDDGVGLLDGSTEYSRPGYSFSGWNTNKDGSGHMYPAGYTGNLSTTDGGTVVLYAQWTASEHSVTFDANGGMFDNTPSITTKQVSCVVGRPFGLYYSSLNASVSCQGYSLTGWYTEAVGGNEVKGTDLVSTGITKLYAHWTPITYTIHFDGNGATSGEMADITGCKYGDEIQLPANAFTREDKIFSGWSAPGVLKLIEDEAKVKNLTTNDGATVTLTAVWNVKTYKVTFYDSDAVYQTAMVPAGSFISKPANPEKSGHTFAGWYKEAACINPWEFTVDTMPKKELSLYAKWTANTYTIILLQEDADLIYTPLITAEYGSSVYTPSIINPWKAGRTLAGWYSTDGQMVIDNEGSYCRNVPGYTDAQGRWTLDNDTTLIAVWEPIRQTFHARDGHADIDIGLTPLSGNYVLILAADNVLGDVYLDTDSDSAPEPAAAYGYKLDKTYSIYSMKADPLSGDIVKLTVWIQLEEGEDPYNVCLRHYSSSPEPGSWDSEPIHPVSVDSLSIEPYPYTHQLVFEVSEFSPFALTYETPIKRGSGSSGSSGGSTIWLTETPTPTPTPTITPTPGPGEPSVKPIETPAGKSPAPFMGILAGLGAAAVVFGLRRK